MSGDFTGGILPPPDAGRDEQAPAVARGDKPVLPRRFYQRAHTELRDEGHALLLDGRAARTPARAPVAVPHAAIAEVLAQEWEAQAEVIDPATMPMTRLVNSVIDGVSQAQPEVAAEIVRFAGSDLLCYRADAPERLVRRQAQLWDPLLDWAREELGARFFLAEGVMFVEQPAQSIETIARIVAEQPSPYAIGGLHVLTALSGSALIALAVARQHITPEAAWLAAHVDEDVQAEIWGADEEAMARRAARLIEFTAAATLVRHTWQF
ncbi:chaperone required for assembly of F1-ATPase [Pseudochelatococcus lubricantis]|uniref:Chaperone required for assembly of F1-ATPase n=1 Tax=Pseudochelatococcus lubricantis TaxID=1538102 RepID=A0ABX0V065_9HYPH|nr:ATP12 family protein [Pseudochelatococcus lubricantis]NIJ58567.1 chaperone required for assembly of F1-ATPase [Pseudochelatococcus lubricantis]